jgi:hypothetical protein
LRNHTSGQYLIDSNIEITGKNFDAARKFFTSLAPRNRLVLDEFVECLYALFVNLTEIEVTEPLWLAGKNQ